VRTHAVAAQVSFAEGVLPKLENKLFVGMIPFASTEEEVSTLFRQHGELTEVFLMTKPDGQSKGCAFVKYALSSSADAAILALNSQHTMEVS
jgi:RNA recognition motif-containing protein